MGHEPDLLAISLSSQIQSFYNNSLKVSISLVTEHVSSAVPRCSPGLRHPLPSVRGNCRGGGAECGRRLSRRWSPTEELWRYRGLQSAGARIQSHRKRQPFYHTGRFACPREFYRPALSLSSFCNGHFFRVKLTSLRTFGKLPALTNALTGSTST